MPHYIFYVLNIANVYSKLCVHMHFIIFLRCIAPSLVCPQYMRTSISIGYRYIPVCSFIETVQYIHFCIPRAHYAQGLLLMTFLHCKVSSKYHYILFDIGNLYTVNLIIHHAANRRSIPQIQWAILYKYSINNGICFVHTYYITFRNHIICVTDS